MATRAQSGKEPRKKAAPGKRGTGGTARAAGKAGTGKTGAKPKTETGKAASKKARPAPPVAAPEQEAALVAQPVAAPEVEAAGLAPREMPTVPDAARPETETVGAIVPPVEAEARDAGAVTEMPPPDMVETDRGEAVEDEVLAPVRELEAAFPPARSEEETVMPVAIPVVPETEAASDAILAPVPVASERPVAAPTGGHALPNEDAPSRDRAREEARLVVTYLAGAMEGLTGQVGVPGAIGLDPELADLALEKLQHFGQALHLLAEAVDFAATKKSGRAGADSSPRLWVRLERRAAGRLALRCFDDGHFFERVLPKLRLDMEALRPLVLAVTRANGSICLRRGRRVEFEITG